jgi:hypothetical protein
MNPPSRRRLQSSWAPTNEERPLKALGTIQKLTGVGGVPRSARKEAKVLVGQLPPKRGKDLVGKLSYKSVPIGPREEIDALHTPSKSLPRSEDGD